MRNVKSYFPFAIVAVLAAVVGWSVSAFGVNQKSSAIATQPEVAQVANNLAPVASQSAPLVIEQAQIAPPELAPVAVAKPVATKTANSATRVPAVRPRVVNQTERSESAEIERIDDSEIAPATTPAREKKQGMSNGTKTAIVIGGGAATGAIIGGIAGGGKGAAIGAAIGGGGGAIYSIIRKKQDKPVW
ncbi:MAG: hypothetical protein ACREBD_05245 [Blastocatellia bacterium]